MNVWCCLFAKMVMELLLIVAPCSFTAHSFIGHFLVGKLAAWFVLDPVVPDSNTIMSNDYLDRVTKHHQINQRLVFAAILQLQYTARPIDRTLPAKTLNVYET